MTLYGYIRQNYPVKTTAQIKQLMDRDCQDLYIEKEDLEIDEELKLLLNNLKKDDTIVVVNLLAFGKNSNDIKQIVDIIIEKESYLISLKDKINTNDKFKFYEILSIISYIDKKINGDKIKLKLNELKKSGKQLGRPSVNESMIKKIRFLRYEKKLTLREISIICGLSTGTIHKYVQ